MSTPPDSPRPSPFSDLPNPLSIDYPSGHYTFLPIIEKCDNFELPFSSSWEGKDCKKHWEEYQKRKKKVNKTTMTTVSSEGNVNESSALDDDDDDEEDEEDDQNVQTTKDFDSEFLCPFFLELPKDCSTFNTSPTPQVTTPTSRRPSFGSTHSGGGGSFSSHHRPSFSRLTPMPSLRPSSPTHSHHGLNLEPESTDDNSDATGKEEEKSQPIGFLRPSIVKALIEDNRKLISVNMRPVWSFSPPIHFPPPPPSRRQSTSSSRSRPPSRRSSHSAHQQPMNFNNPNTNTGNSSGFNTPGTPTTGESGTGNELKKVIEGLRTIAASGDTNSNHIGNEGVNDFSGKGIWAVGFEDWVNEGGQDLRKEHIDRLCRNWKMKGQFSECLGGWRNELYTIYGPKSSKIENPLPGSNVAFTMERSACALFGFTTFGVHCNAYVEEEGQPLKLWVPRRSPNKQTWPSYLDNTVAGGITAGDSPRESIIRECAEEASLPPSFVAQHIKSVGCVIYNYRTDHGWLQPEVQYTYDLKLPPPSTGEESIIPTTNPSDGEVESFSLMTLTEVIQKMIDGEFKPNCALVLVDFLIRHGYLTPESDTRFLEISKRLRRGMVLPGPA